MRKRRRDAFKKHVHSKLLFRQRLFFLIITGLVIASAVNVFQHKIDGWLAVSGFLLSTFIGLLFSRMFKVHWDKETEKVVARLDAVGIALFVVYLAIDFVRTPIFKHWLSGPALSVFGLIFLTGLLLGRFLGIIKRIRAVLHREQKIGRVS